MTPFGEAFADVVGLEGGYSSNPSDPGNWTGGEVGSGELHGTKYGISAAAFPTLDIEHLSFSVAQAIYRDRYWHLICGDSLPVPVGLIVFDCAVNQGVGRATRILQAAVGATQDGVIGPMTVAAVRAKTDVRALVLEIAARRAQAYAETEDTIFWLGWFRRLLSIVGRALALGGI